MSWQLSQIVVTTLPCSNITPTLALSSSQTTCGNFFLRPTRRAGLSLNSVSVQFYLYSGFFYRDTVTGHFAEETGRKIGQKHQAWTPKTASNWAQKSEKKNISSPLGRKTVKRSEEPYSLYLGSVDTEKWIPLFPLCPLRLCSSLSLSLFLFTTVLSLQCRTSCSSVRLSIIIIMPHSQWGEAVWLVLRFFQWGKTISLNFKWLIFCTWEGQKKKKKRHFKSHYKIKNAC